MADSSFFMMSGRSLLRFYFPGQTFQNFNDSLIRRRKYTRLTARLKFRLGILIKKRGGALSLSSMR